MQNTNTDLFRIINQAITPVSVQLTFSILVPMQDSDLDRVVVVDEWNIPLN